MLHIISQVKKDANVAAKGDYESYNCGRQLLFAFCERDPSERQSQNRHSPSCFLPTMVISDGRLNVLIPVSLPPGEMHEPVPSQRRLVYSLAIRGFRHTLRLSPYNSGSIVIYSSASMGDFRFAGRREPSDSEPSASVDC